MASYINYSITTREELKEWILDECGGGLQTIEITDKQLNGAINSALEVFTKFATFDTKYIALQLSDYDSVSGGGFDLTPYRVASIEAIEDDGMMGFGDSSDQLWSMSNMLESQGVYPYNSGSGGSQGTGWVSVHMAHEYSAMSKTMRAAFWDFEFNRHDGSLLLIPDPATLGVDLDQFLCIATECIPPESELFGEEMVKAMALGKAMMIIGRVRKKFSSIQLLGGGQVDDSIFDDGKELLESTMEKLRKQEGPSFGMMVG